MHFSSQFWHEEKVCYCALVLKKPIGQVSIFIMNMTATKSKIYAKNEHIDPTVQLYSYSVNLSELIIESVKE